MRAMFKVTFRPTTADADKAFSTETVIAENAIAAIKRATNGATKKYGGIELFVSDVELLGVETVEGA